MCSHNTDGKTVSLPLLIHIQVILSMYGHIPRLAGHLQTRARRNSGMVEMAEMAEMAEIGNCSFSLVSQVWHIVIPGYVIVPSGRSRGVLWVLKNPLAN